MVLTAIIALAFLEGTAILTGIDGKFLGLTMALIGALAGVPLGAALAIKKFKDFKWD